MAARVAYVCGRVCGLQWVGEFLGDVGKLSGLFMVLGALLCGFVRLRMFLYVDAGFRGAYVAAAGLVACATVSLRLFLNLVSVALGVRPVCPVFSIPPHPCICWLHASFVTSCEAAMCGRMVASTHGLVCP